MPIALATAAALPGLHPDDRLLLDALRRRDVDAEPAIWEDSLYAWERADRVVIRSAWDYSWRREAFLAWADRVGERLRNTPTVVRWNTHKRYLLDLAGAGVSVVPTVVLAAGSTVRLDAVLDEHGWDDAVVKAAVGQSGRYARRITRGDTAGQDHAGRVLAREDLLVQPFLPGIYTTGELSVVFVGDQCSHAVRKRAAPGDFRVHDDYGGSVTREEPDQAVLALAEAALRAAGEPLLYGRVDVVHGLDGTPMVMELELVEPELFFSHAPEAAELLADALVAGE